MKAPEKLYFFEGEPILSVRSKKRENANIEYTRTDALIKKAMKFLYDYNKNMVKKHGARATLGCGEFTINVGEFEKYMKGE